MNVDAPGVTPRPRISLLLKITVLTSLPILGIMMAALLLVNHRLAGEVNRNVAADLQRAALAFENQMEREGENLERVGVVVARDPKFFALLTLPRGDRKDADFQATLLGVARDFQHDAEAPLFDVTDEHGTLLARAGQGDDAAGRAPGAGADRSRWPLVREALAGRAARGYLVEGERAYRVAVVPIVVDGALAGTLTLGRTIDAALAERLKATTRSDVVFVVNGTASIRTTLRSSLAGRLAALPQSPGVVQVADGEHRFLALAGRLEGPTAGGRVGFALLRSLDQETAVLGRVGRELTIAGAALIVVALLVGILVSTGVTRPVRRIVEAANAMRGGNYDLPLDIRSADEMGTLAAHFEAMRAAQRHEIERLEEIDRMKSDFIAIASHEILTPVTTIRAFADLMGEGAAANDTELQREGFRAIREAAGSLTRLARDLTNMSLIDRKRLPLRLASADLGLVAEEVAVRTIALAAERRQAVSLSIEPELLHPRVDADYLRQALTNIAQNAVRFTRDGGSIEIGARRNGAAIEIYVADSGIGISKDDFERIFSKIVELKDVNLHSSGTTEFNSSGLGLGLSIARGIVEAHGGEIRVESELGRGSTFTISIPAEGSLDQAA
ncbi:MAG TPA: HAMP domain-containing sensor histidine kinase [Candidatus Binatia bacterium]|nr:HAMP domain-containing sensor histidine kinase [Candidatus Binatia bacterium]